MTDAEKIRQLCPSFIAWLEDSFAKNPGQCEVRARLLRFLRREEELDDLFLSENLPREAGAQFLLAMKEANGNADIVYRFGTVKARRSGGATTITFAV